MFVFQCHKCRSINYDERDPFLCISCGFCKFVKFDFTIVGKSCCAVDPIEWEEDSKQTLLNISTLLDPLRYHQTQWTECAREVCVLLGVSCFFSFKNVFLNESSPSFKNTSWNSRVNSTSSPRSFSSWICVAKNCANTTSNSSRQVQIPIICSHTRIRRRAPPSGSHERIRRRTAWSAPVCCPILTRTRSRRRRSSIGCNRS